jgi:hypothetical protein
MVSFDSWSRVQRTGYAVAIAAAAFHLWAVAPPAGAFELLDGTLQVHGFYEAQMRAISDNYDSELDLTQWYNILNVEVEWEVLPDGLGPIDLLSVFARVEARYDCVWTRGCGTMRSANTYGDRAAHLPPRLSGARRRGLTGAVTTGDVREIAGIPLDQLGFEFKDAPVGNVRKPAYLWHVPGVDTLFGVPGPDGVSGTEDDPAFYTFARFVEPGREYRFGLRRIPGAEAGQDLQVLGPWRPRDKIRSQAALADRANPFNPNDFNPATSTFGSAELPYRPAPNIGNQANGKNSRSQPRGLFIPNPVVADLIDSNSFSGTDTNFTQTQLAFNRGASQQDEGELKELYFDAEFFDSRLWLRVGKQSIVWGKTELFRTTDQMNPQDLALASLPSLEESRISLWSARAVWSLYEVGPLSDVRIEGAVNFDQFEPVDIGRCGEPYAPNPACDKSAGLFAHGLVGQGLAGEVRPPNPWEDPSGLEGGVRLEFRWDRFSFAITDFYGYDDFPYLDVQYLYRRNVDPNTGRPRVSNQQGECVTGGEVSCLQPGSKGDRNALHNHHANQQRFAVICSSSVGFNELDRTVCAQSVLNSQALLAGVPIAQLLGAIFRGNSSDEGFLFFYAKNLYGLLAGSSLADPFVPSFATFGGLGLPNDGDLNGDGVYNTDDIPLVALTDDGDEDFDGGPTDQGPLAGQRGVGIDSVLSDEQEALLGCGPYWQTDCDADGIDLLNTEASIFAESWPGAQGTFGDWDTFEAGKKPYKQALQPGTDRFLGGAICTRFVNGKVVMLPGCRGPGEPGYNRQQDGTPPNLRQATTGQPKGQDILTHPFTGQNFRSEMSAFSWNAVMVLVGFSGLGKPDNERLFTEFKPSDPFRTGGCSFRKPQLCDVVQSFYAILHTTRRTMRAAGNGTYGRSDFDWHQGGTGVLRYNKRNVLGFSADFAEDVTKSNWSMEFTWIEDNKYADANDIDDGFRSSDTLNLTISADRPTFINFLNANRTFFFNTQWFFQYITDYEKGFRDNGPWNVLATFSVQTGYWQDRLTPSLTLVYDFKSVSGAAIPEVTYQYTSNFSVSIGAAMFMGRWQRTDPPIANVADDPFRAGRSANDDFVENGLSVIRERDEVYLRIRYTF